MAESDLRQELRGQIQHVRADVLLPHHRRGALLIVTPQVDVLEVAEAVAGDDAERVEALIKAEQVYRPTLADLATWCVDDDMRLQFVILQPYVLAQPIITADPS